MWVVPAIVQHLRRTLCRRNRTEARGRPSHRLGLTVVFLYDARKGEDGEPLEETPLEKVGRAAWGMLYADDAGTVSRCTDGIARMMAVLVVACQEFGSTVSERKTEFMCLWSELSSPEATLHVKAAGQRYKQTAKSSTCCQRGPEYFP